MRAPLRMATTAVFTSTFLFVTSVLPSAAAEEGSRSPLAEALADAGRLVREAATERSAPARPAAAPAPASLRLAWPADGVVSSEFGMRWGRPHKGIDMATPIGTPVRAPADGVVVGAAWMSGYGLALHLDHGGGVTTFYGHLSQAAVVEGQRFRKGDVVAQTGNTGRSTAPHLHFEVRVGPDQHDPRAFLSGQPKPLS